MLGDLTIGAVAKTVGQSQPPQGGGINGTWTPTIVEESMMEEGMVEESMVEERTKRKAIGEEGEGTGRRLRTRLQAVGEHLVNTNQSTYHENHRRYTDGSCHSSTCHSST